MKSDRQVYECLVCETEKKEETLRGGLWAVYAVLVMPVLALIGVWVPAFRVACVVYGAIVSGLLLWGLYLTYKDLRANHTAMRLMKDILKEEES